MGDFNSALLTSGEVGSAGEDYFFRYADGYGWVEIHADNTALIRTGKCDFGQSAVYTSYRRTTSHPECY